MALAYLAELCLPITASASRRGGLRSATTSNLVIPRCRLPTYGTRAFSVAGPVCWNSLPDYLKSSDLSFNCFRQQLEAFLFCEYWHQSQHYFSALSPAHTVAEKWDCRTKVRRSPLSRRYLRQSHFSATVSLFCDSVDRALETLLLLMRSTNAWYLLTYLLILSRDDSRQRGLSSLGILPIFSAILVGRSRTARNPELFVA